MCLAGFAAMNSQSAVAAESGFYGGVGVGLSMANIAGARVGGNLLGSGLTVNSIREDDRDFAYKAFGGYKVNRYFALEAGYFNLGEFSYTAQTTPAGTSTGNIKISGFNLDLLGILPFTDQFSAFGRVGAQYAKSKDSFGGTGAGAGNSNISYSGTNYKFGAGLQYDFSDTVGLRTEWERYRINDAVGHHGDIDMLSVGLIVSFGGSKSAHASRTDTPPPAAATVRETPPAPVAQKPEPVAKQPEPVVAAAPAPLAAEPEPVVTAAPAPRAAEPEPVVAAPAAAVAAAPVVTEAPVLVVVPVPRTQTYCSILDIQFEINGDTIQRQEEERLDKVGIFMRKYPDTTAVIEGHTDNVGTPANNLKLSQRRADSVVTYLTNHGGIAQSRLKAVGYGDTRPIANPKTEVGRRQNRRINAVIACATDVEGLKPVARRITMALEMEFDAYKADVRPQYREELRKVADFMKAHPEVTATVEGHTGNLQATPKLAMEMSQLRARNVLNYLVDNFGIARSRLKAEGFGQTRRFAYNTSKEGQQENRRVNIIFDYPS